MKNSAGIFISNVLCTSLGAVFFMLKFVAPMYGDIFNRFGGRLPWITQKTIDISKALQSSLSLIGLVLLLFIIFILLARRAGGYRRIVSGAVLRVPVAGNLVQRIYLARFCNSMRLLINSRLPLLQAISLVNQMIRYYPLESVMLELEIDILKGSALHESMKRFNIFSSKMVQLVKVGEEINQLDYFFGKISERFIEEIEHRTSILSSIMEPLIIIFPGGWSLASY